MKPIMSSVSAFVLVFFLTVFGFIAFSFYQYEAPSSSEKVDASSAPIERDQMERREAIQTRWIDALRQSAVSTGNTDMKAVLLMIETKTTPAVTAEDGLWIADNSKPIRLMVLVSEDAKYPIWKSYLDEKAAGAWFLPYKDLRAIVLRDDANYGDKTRTAILTHEGTHTLHFLKKGSLEAKNQTEYCNEERDTYSTANSVLYSFGGKAYFDFRDQRVADMLKNVRQTEAGIQLPIPDKAYQDIEKVIGPFASKEETAWWVATSWIDTVFQFVDLYASGSPAEKDVMKSQVICGMSQALGVIPAE